MKILLRENMAEKPKNIKKSEKVVMRYDLDGKDTVELNKENFAEIDFDESSEDEAFEGFEDNVVCDYKLDKFKLKRNENLNPNPIKQRKMIDVVNDFFNLDDPMDSEVDFEGFASPGSKQKINGPDAEQFAPGSIIENGLVESNVSQDLSNDVANQNTNNSSEIPFEYEIPFVSVDMEDTESTVFSNQSSNDRFEDALETSESNSSIKKKSYDSQTKEIGVDVIESHIITLTSDSDDTDTGSELFELDMEEEDPLAESPSLKIVSCNSLQDSSNSLVEEDSEDQQLMDPLQFISCDLSDDPDYAQNEVDKEPQKMKSVHSQLKADVRIRVKRLNVFDITNDFCKENQISVLSGLRCRHQILSAQRPNKSSTQSAPVPAVRHIRTIHNIKNFTNTWHHQKRLNGRVDTPSPPTPEQYAPSDPFTHSVFAPIINKDQPFPKVKIKDVQTINDEAFYSGASQPLKVTLNASAPVSTQTQQLPAYFIRAVGSPQMNTVTFLPQNNASGQPFIRPPNMMQQSPISIVQNSIGNENQFHIIRPNIINPVVSNASSNQPIFLPLLFPKKSNSQTSDLIMSPQLSPAQTPSAPPRPGFSLHSEFAASAQKLMGRVNPEEVDTAIKKNRSIKHTFSEWVHDLSHGIKMCQRKLIITETQYCEVISTLKTLLDYGYPRRVKSLFNVAYQLLCTNACCCYHVLNFLRTPGWLRSVDPILAVPRSQYESFCEFPVPIQPNEGPNDAIVLSDNDLFALKRFVFLVDKQTRAVLFPLPPQCVPKDNENVDKITVVVLISAKLGLGPGLIVFPKSLIGMNIISNLNMNEMLSDRWVISTHQKGGLTHSMMLEFMNDAVLSFLREHNGFYMTSFFAFDWWWNMKCDGLHPDFQCMNLFNIHVYMSKKHDPFDVCISTTLNRLWGLSVRKFSKGTGRVWEDEFPRFIYEVLKNICSPARLRSWCRVGGLYPMDVAKADAFVSSAVGLGF